MQKNIKLTLLGAMLFCGAALYADDKEKGAVTSAVQTEQKVCRLSAVCSKGTTLLKDALRSKYTWALAGLAATAGIGYYAYTKFVKEQAKAEML